MSNANPLARGGHVWSLGDYSRKAPLPLPARLFIQFAIITPAFLGALKLFLYLTVDYDANHYIFHVTKSTFSYNLAKSTDGFFIAIVGLIFLLFIVAVFATIRCKRKIWMGLCTFAIVCIAGFVLWNFVNHTLNDLNPISKSKFSSWVHSQTGPLVQKDTIALNKAFASTELNSYSLTGTNGKNWLLVQGSDETKYTLSQTVTSK